jgi:exodeoxyribonuclease VII small subunit
MKKKTGEGEKAAAAPNFEDALARLESIVREMEGGTLSLEAMMARFEEGRRLVKLCSETLNQVERKIEMLVQEGGEVVAQPFAVEGGPVAEEGAGDAGGDAPAEAPPEAPF